MNFIRLYIGDYLRDTGTLTVSEHGAYVLMLLHHYATEHPLPTGRDLHRLLRAETKVDREAIDSVSRRFWVETESGLTNARAKREMERAEHQRDVNRTVGKLGGRPKRTETESVSESVSESEPNDNPNQTPDTIKRLDKAPSELPASRKSALPATEPFDGSNAEILNGKAIVPLSSAWDLPEAWGVDAEKLGFRASEVLREAERFRQYWTAGKGMGKRRSVRGWRQSWSNWLGKSERDMR